MMGTSPLITTAALASITGAVIALLVAFGVRLTADQTAAIMGLVAVAAPWIVALVGHNTTTPLSDPRDETGQPLVRAVDGMPTIAQTRSMAKK